jgi:glyoxylase I family protein
MQASVYHLQLNVRDAATALPFYRALLGYLDYRVTHEQPGVLAMSNGGTDFWLLAAPAERGRHAPHRKNPGLNHVALRVPARADVERFHEEFLKARGIPTLYGGPREYPEYRPGYYAVFFEDPDRLKLEVVHVP